MKLQKAFKDNCTNTNYKRPFILDKIERDIHHRNIRNIRNFINFKNQDFLTKMILEAEKKDLSYIGAQYNSSIYEFYCPVCNKKRTVDDDMFLKDDEVKA